MRKILLLLAISLLAVVSASADQKITFKGLDAYNGWHLYILSCSIGSGTAFSESNIPTESDLQQSDNEAIEEFDAYFLPATLPDGMTNSETYADLYAALKGMLSYRTYDIIADGQTTGQSGCDNITNYQPTVLLVDPDMAPGAHYVVLGTTYDAPGLTYRDIVIDLSSVDIIKEGYLYVDADEAELVALIGDKVFYSDNDESNISAADGKVLLASDISSLDLDAVYDLSLTNVYVFTDQDDPDHMYTFNVADGVLVSITETDDGELIRTFTSADDTPTALPSVNNSRSTSKRIVDGHIVIEKNGILYDLSGNRL